MLVLLDMKEFGQINIFTYNPVPRSKIAINPNKYEVFLRHKKKVFSENEHHRSA